MIKRVDKIIEVFLNAILGTLMLSITCLVIIQIIARYVLHLSLGGAEELPIYLLICTVWVGAVCNARSNSHIKVDLFGLCCKNEKIKLIVNCMADLITVFFVMVFTVCGINFIQKSYSNGDITSGLYIPLWVFHVIIEVCLLLIAVYYLTHMITKIKEVIQWKS